MRKREDVLHARATCLRKVGMIFMQVGQENNENESSPGAPKPAPAALQPSPTGAEALYGRAVARGRTCLPGSVSASRVSAEGRSGGSWGHPTHCAGSDGSRST